MKISVLIATKDRPEKLRLCLASILRNSCVSYEVIVVDQSVGSETKKFIMNMKIKRIRYRHLDQIGNTKALNEALRMARGDIYVFTDDDCIVQPSWLSTIAKTYMRHPQISGLSGQTLPYIKTKPDAQSICPGIYESRTKSRFVTSVGPTVHSPTAGFGKGTNMSFRKEVFQKLGGFKEWLGPGALAPGAGNETEFIYRAIKNKFELYFLPTLIVYHNRWITKHESEILRSTKIQGYTAFITYHMIKNLDAGLFDGLFRFRWLCMPTIRACFRLVLLGKSRLSSAHTDALRLSYGLAKGVTIGAVYAIRDIVTFR